MILFFLFFLLRLLLFGTRQQSTTFGIKLFQSNGVFLISFLVEGKRWKGIKELDWKGRDSFYRIWIGGWFKWNWNRFHSKIKLNRLPVVFSLFLVFVHTKSTVCWGATRKGIMTVRFFLVCLFAHKGDHRDHESKMTRQEHYYLFVCSSPTWTIRWGGQELSGRGPDWIRQEGGGWGEWDWQWVLLETFLLLSAV